MHLRSRISMLLALCITSTTLFAGCDSNPQPVDPNMQAAAGVSLVSSPDSIVVAADALQSFYLSTSPAGSLEWKVTAKPSWVTVEPMAGFIDKNIVEVKVTQKGSPPEGPTSGWIEIISSGGASKVEVKNMPESEPTSEAAATPTRKPGNATPTSRATVAAAATQTSVLAQTRAEASTSRIQFPAGKNEATFTLANKGSGTLDWVIAASDAWISVTPQSGKLGSGESATITVGKDETKASSPSATGFITIGSNSVDGDITIQVELASAAVTVLDHRAVDAEYNEKTDKLITVSTGPSVLHVMDMETHEIKTVALPASPSCVSVQPDGKYAAVGHNAHISYINLETMKVERTYDIASDVHDIVLPGNGHVYAFPSNSDIDLASGGELSAEGRMHRPTTIVRLHPSGNYLYSADTGISPDDISKFDISTGRLVALGDSPYHGDYRMGGNLWFSEDGNRIFVASGTVFRSSTAESQDMIYAGQLEAVGGLRWVSTSTQAQRVFVLDGGSYWSTQQPGLRVYDTEFLNYLGTVDLPPFVVPTGAGGTREVSTQGYGVFVNNAKSKIHLLLNADPSAGLNNDWGVATFEMSKMP